MSGSDENTAMGTGPADEGGSRGTVSPPGTPGQANAEPPSNSGRGRGKHNPPRPAEAPPAFALGWLMAAIYRPLSENLRGEKTDHLPTVGQLDDEHLTDLAVLELQDLLVKTHRALETIVGGSTLLVTATAINDALVYFGLPDLTPDLVRMAQSGGNDDEASLAELHWTILRKLTVAKPSWAAAYQLGVTLSDTCSRPQDLASFLHRFHRRRLATLRGWLAQAENGGIPPSAAAVVSGSPGTLVCVGRRQRKNPAGQMGERAQGTLLHPCGPAPRTRQETVTARPRRSPASSARALDSQSRSWRSLLAGEADATAEPGVQAWIQAGESMVRTARQVAGRIVRHFWVVLAVILAVMAGLLYVIFANTTEQDVTRIWASLVTVAAAFGITGSALRTGARRVATNAELPVWRAAEVDARAWAATVLPVLPMGAVRLYRLRQRGVGVPVVTKRYSVDPIPPRRRGQS